jgi:DNA-binding GntR family transcriptional regulator
MSSDAAGQVCTVRGLLEGWAARTACLQLTEDQLATMRSMSREMGESVRQGNVYEVMEIDIAFHTLICRCSDNDYLFDRWQSLNALHGALLASRLAYYNYDHVGIVRRHEELCETLACRDADAAEAAIRSHYIGAFLENAADSVAVIGLPSPPFRQEKISEGA